MQSDSFTPRNTPTPQPSDSVISHQIREGERWDLLAYHYYGDIGEVSRLIDANPQLPFCEQLPVGQWLFVPVLTVKTTSQADLPPWLQAD